MTSARIVSGTAMKKHQRQPSHEASVMNPPSSGPPTVETAMTPPR